MKVLIRDFEMQKLCLDFNVFFWGGPSWASGGVDFWPTNTAVPFSRFFAWMMPSHVMASNFP